MKSLCFIPARGGSKRLPRKNILKINGVPLITRVANICKDAGIFDSIVVSTDDLEIKEICLLNDVKVHDRNNKLGQDRSTVVEVMLDLLKSFKCDNFCCVYPTSCLLKPLTLKESYNKFVSDNSINVLMGSSKYNYHPVQALVLKEGGLAVPLLPSYKNVQSQFYPEVRVSNGSFYWARKHTFLKEKTFYSKKLGLFDVTPSQVCDINTIEDFLEVKSILAP